MRAALSAPERQQVPVPRRDPAASRPSSSRRGGAPRARTDGKIDVQCPQCAAAYRIPAENLDAKIECRECHRVFFAKTTAGRKVKPPDNTKMYVGIGVGAVALIGLFVAMSMGGDKPKAAPPPVVQKVETFGRGNHPRTADLVNWARAVGTDNRLVLDRHSDFNALGAAFGMSAPIDPAEVVKTLLTHESTKYLRELQCESGELASEADMTAEAGKATLFVTPKPGDDTYLAKFRGELEVGFRMDGAQARVTAIQVKTPPVRNPAKPDPSKRTFVPNKDIAKPKEVEISDSAGTRKVQESTPAPVPHWDGATPELRQLADEVVAGILKSAEPEVDNPGRHFNRATLRVQTDEERKAVVPRVLNAMYELYSDVNANNLKISQLNRAMVAIIGFAVNYQVEDTGDPAKDKAARESCIRQWFAFWWKFSNDFSKWIDTTESLEMPAGDAAERPAAPKPTGK